MSQIPPWGWVLVGCGLGTLGWVARKQSGQSLTWFLVGTSASTIIGILIYEAMKKKEV